jgi:acetyl esterase/lipase
MHANELADPGLLAPQPVRIIDHAVSYLGVKYELLPGWRPLTLDLHVPATETAAARPVVVYAHGGGFSVGTKEMGPWAQLPRHGLAVASIDYRLSSEAGYPAALADTLAAIQWLCDNAMAYNLDPSLIAGWGSSAGGYLMVRAALSDQAAVRLYALVLHYPLSNPIDVPSLRAFFAGLDDDALAHASVSHAVASASHIPPVHLSHGDEDRHVPLERSVHVHQAILAAGGASTLNIVNGARHADPRFATPEVVDPAVRFLKEMMCVSPT